MAPIREVLLDARARFHDLLSTDMEPLVAKAVADDDLQPVSDCSLLLACYLECAAHDT